MRDSTKESRKRAARSYLLSILALPFLLGLVLAFAPSFFHIPGELQDLLTNVGFGLVGTALGAALPLAIVGNTAFSQEEVIADALASVSNLVAQARALGVVALGRDRDSQAFENQQPLVERWKYLLNHADEVDVLCIDDSAFLGYQALNEMAPRIARRMRGGDKIHLRILMSSDLNEALPMVGAWIDNEEYAKDQVHNQVEGLRRHKLDGPDILRRHNEMLGFTMLRGDTYMYVMFYLPGQGAGPIIEIRKREALDAASAYADRKPDLFEMYQDLFEKWWDKCDPSKVE